MNELIYMIAENIRLGLIKDLCVDQSSSKKKKTWKKNCLSGGI